MQKSIPEQTIFGNFVIIIIYIVCGGYTDVWCVYGWGGVGWWVGGWVWVCLPSLQSFSNTEY